MKLGNKVLRDSLFTLGQTIAQLVRGLAIIPLITNLLGAGDYGIWTTVTAVIGLAQSTGGAHLHGALIRYSSGPEMMKRIYADILFLTLLLGSIVSGIVLFFGNLIDVDVLLEAQDIDASVLVLVSAGIVISDMLMQVNLNFPRALGDIRRFEILRTTRMIVETAALFVVFAGGGGVVSGLLALLAISILGNLGLFLLIVRSYGLARPSLSRFPQYLRYGVPMIPQELSKSILSQVDRFLLLYFLSPTIAGIYSVAYGVSGLLKRLTSILNSTLYPTVAGAWDGDKTVELKNLYAGIFKYITILAVPALFGIALLSKPLLSLISTPQIANQGAFLVPILAAGFLVRAYQDSIEYILTASEQTSKIGFAVVLAAAVNFTLNILLIPRYGLLGAAAATFISEILVTAIVYYFVGQEIHIPFPTRTLFAALGSAVVMSLVLYFLPTVSNGIFEIIAYVIIGAVIYFAVMITVGEFSPREIYDFVNS